MTDTATFDVDHDVDAPADSAVPGGPGGPAEPAEPATTADEAPTTRRGRGRRRRRGDGGVSPATRLRVAQGMLWVLVAAGPLTGGAALALHAGSGADPSPASAPAGEPSSTAVEGFAERYVATFLGQAGDGAEEALAPFYAGTAELGEVEAGSVWVARTVPVAADQIGEGYWEVTVAAEVLTANDGEAYTPAGWRYYAVGVVDTEEGQAATGLPSQVSAPRRLEEAPDRAVASLSAPGDEPPVEAAAGFLRAYLAGDGELARYTAPDTTLTPLAQPYQSVEVTQAGLAELAADRVLVRAQVVATDSDGLAHAAGHSLELVSRDGRWEVTALHGAPPLESHVERSAS